MQPRPQRISYPEPAGLFHQDEEGRLKGVFGVVPVGKHSMTDAQDHRSVPFDQHGKGKLGGLASKGGEALQKLSVAQVPDGSHAVERANGPVYVGSS